MFCFACYQSLRRNKNPGNTGDIFLAQVSKARNYHCAPSYNTLLLKCSPHHGQHFPKIVFNFNDNPWVQRSSVGSPLTCCKPAGLSSILGSASQGGFSYWANWRWGDGQERWRMATEIMCCMNVIISKRNIWFTIPKHTVFVFLHSWKKSLWFVNKPAKMWSNIKSANRFSLLHTSYKL